MNRETAVFVALVAVFAVAGASVPPWYPPLPPATRPSHAMPLRNFPRPKDDNGRGIHFGIELSEEAIAANVPHLQYLHMKWTTVYAPDHLQAAKAGVPIWKAGIQPIIRPAVHIDQSFVPWDNFITAMKTNGIPVYIQIYNEPSNHREWNHWPGDNQYAHIFGQKWAEAAAFVIDHGAHPGLQILGKEAFDAAVKAVNAINRTDIWDKAFFSLHNYGVNHPPAYPYDPLNQKDHPHATILTDDTCVLNLLAYSIWMYKHIGFVLPIIGGEGGWQWGADDDRRYPKVNATLHASYHVSMFSWFRFHNLSNGQDLPDYLFSVHPWLLYAGGGWGADAWYGGPLGTKNETIKAVHDIPFFVRKFSWSGAPTPPSPPPPPPPSPMPPSPSPPPGPPCKHPTCGICVRKGLPSWGHHVYNGSLHCKTDQGKAHWCFCQKASLGQFTCCPNNTLASQMAWLRP
eukprot:TRINITY_DN24_c0_g1_i1.p1 TRINITY_DN24_c0_g1~~TRINITY_DN24_c0_g1_i1.p1  ORF type:complete len:457 (+),score=29.58 TRINITY_DN24_c0_g1_i1:3-1373(+)